MAFKLTKAEQARREDLKSELEDAFSAYETAVSNAKEFVGSVVERARNEYDNKSEKWQDSDKAASALEWVENWETAGEEIEIPEDDYVTMLEELPDEAEG